MSNKLKLGLALFFIGFLGVLTMLTITIPLDNIPEQVLKKFSPQTIQLLILINPTILLAMAVFIGTWLHDQVGFKVPAVSALLNIEPPFISFIDQLKSGVLLGILAGLFASLWGYFYQSSLPQEFLALEDKIKITVIARFMYGGFTEELMLRYGFMTFVVWIIYKIAKQLNNTTYWIGISLATILFAVGHFPAVFSAVPQPTIGLLTYVFIGNAAVGLVFGWLYWKKGLEAAFVAHICTHIIMLLTEKNSITEQIQYIKD